MGSPQRIFPSGILNQRLNLKFESDLQNGLVCRIGAAVITKKPIVTKLPTNNAICIKNMIHLPFLLVTPFH